MYDRIISKGLNDLSFVQIRVLLYSLHFLGKHYVLLEMATLEKIFFTKLKAVVIVQ